MSSESQTLIPATGASLARRIIFWVLCFSSILALLLHLPGIMPMHTFALACGLPAAVALVLVWLWARKDKDEALLRALRLGLVGGLLGTLAYDIVRIPLHMTGGNPLAPIRVYGLWIAGGQASTWTTDLIGFLYHLSNGITFAWIYALVLRKKHWAYAIVWGLLIESVALVTSFGDIFGLTGNAKMTILALAAHVAYGFPLGWVCWKEAQAEKSFFPFLEKPMAWGLAVLTLMVTGWFLLARPSARSGEIQQEIALIDRGMIPSWSNLEQGSSLTLTNKREQAVEFRIAPPGTKQAESQKVRLEPGDTLELPFEKTGITRIFAPDENVRSVYIIVHQRGDYRPAP